MGKSSKLFNGALNQTLISRITPTTGQREFLQKQWNMLADHLKETVGPRHGYIISTWLQGSYKFATLIKPVHPGEEYDVDVGVYFEWTDDTEHRSPTPKVLRDWVQTELINYEDICDEVKAVAKPPKERCSRISYVKQFHIDTPVYHLDPETDTRRLACFSNKWEHSDPKAIYKWFKDAVSWDDRDQLRRLVRYIKAWAAVSFKDSEHYRPSSIFLTVLVTKAYQELSAQRRFSIDNDDDALIAVIKKLHDWLCLDRKVGNPVDPTEDLNRMTSEAWDGFLPRLTALRDIAELADDAEEVSTAALIWSEAFSFLMPLPEIDEAEVVEARTGRAVMQLPEIQIQVFSPKASAPFATYRNSVPGVGKDCKLVFTILNPHVVPDFATVEWTVRNEGVEADAHSDLGHRAVGIRLLSTHEHTAYTGRHFMDCVVKVSGQVSAVRRVPVSIRNIPHSSRNPPKPGYTRIQSTLRRRR